MIPIRFFLLNRMPVKIPIGLLFFVLLNLMPVKVKLTKIYS